MCITAQPNAICTSVSLKRNRTEALHRRSRLCACSIWFSVSGSRDTWSTGCDRRSGLWRYVLSPLMVTQPQCLYEMLRHGPRPLYRIRANLKRGRGQAHAMNIRDMTRSSEASTPSHSGRQENPRTPPATSALNGVGKGRRVRLGVSKIHCQSCTMVNGRDGERVCRSRFTARSHRSTTEHWPVDKEIHTSWSLCAFRSVTKG